MLEASFHRRAVRRAVRTRCHAVGMREFRLLGESAFDLSPRGMLLACDSHVQLGDDVQVSFLAPGSDAIWMDAEANVARIIEGQRPGDRGYCVGLEFTYFERTERHELLSRLAGLPPPVPQRRLRSAGARGMQQSVAVAPPAVAIHRIVSLWDEPVIPLTRAVRLSHPRGVFTA